MIDYTDRSTEGSGQGFNRGYGGGGGVAADDEPVSFDTTQSKDRSSAHSRITPSASTKAKAPAYLLAIVLGLFSGWVNQVVDDALLTALCMLGFAMLLGTWKPQRPWRWVLLVWIGVPIVLAYYAYVVRWPHDRGQVYGAFLQILAASAGGFGGHFMREMIDNVFLKKER